MSPKNHQRGHSAIAMSITKIAKKDEDKNKTKNLSYIEYYTYKQKSQYVSKYLKNPKN